MRALATCVLVGVVACSGGSELEPPALAPFDAAVDSAIDDVGASMPDAPVVLPPLDDFSLGPYPSALDILLRSLRASAKSYNTSVNYDHSAAQGYVLQAIGTLLEVARGRSLPGGEATREELVTIALGEIDELIKAMGRTEDGQPGFGLPEAWDAFGDGSVNPAYTCYSWQTGMVAVGAVRVLRYLDTVGGHDAERARVRDFVTKIVAPWAKRWTSITEAGQPFGWYWYSSKTADAMAVHNTSALIATAVHELDPTNPRPAQYASLLARRLRTTSAGGYAWNYVDDGYPISKRIAEDISHALVTLQFMRYARSEGWFDDSDMTKLSRTILAQMWRGNPALMNGRVDGSSGGDQEWAWTAAAAVGLAAHANAPGGRSEIFDYARSVIVSSYLTANGAPLATATVDSVRALAIAQLFANRPSAYAPDSRWVRVAGPGDEVADGAGGVRFYTADWSPPAPLTSGGVALPARTAAAPNANLIVDLPEGEARRVVISITYRSDESGSVEQWDGSKYVALAPLPSTRFRDGKVGWMRTSFMLLPTRFDYQTTTAGINVLLQLTSRSSVSRIEATPH